VPKNFPTLLGRWTIKIRGLVAQAIGLIYWFWPNRYRAARHEPGRLLVSRIVALVVATKGDAVCFDSSTNGLANALLRLQYHALESPGIVSLNHNLWNSRATAARLVELLRAKRAEGTPDEA